MLFFLWNKENNLPVNIWFYIYAVIFKLCVAQQSISVTPFKCRSRFVSSASRCASASAVLALSLCAGRTGKCRFSEATERSLVTALQDSLCLRAVVRPTSPLWPMLTGPNRRMCEVYRMPIPGEQWDLFLCPQYNCVCVVLALGSLRSHLFPNLDPKSVMQVSGEETHFTVVRTDCTDDVIAEWLPDKHRMRQKTLTQFLFQ